MIGVGHLKKAAVNTAITTAYIPLRTTEIATTQAVNALNLGDAAASAGLGVTTTGIQTAHATANDALETTKKASAASAKVTSNLLDFAGKASGSVTNLAGNAADIGSETTSVALKSAATIANKSLEAATSATSALIMAIDGVFSSFVASSTRKKQSNVEMMFDRQLQNFSKSFEKNIGSNIHLVAKSLGRYVEDQSEFIRKSLVALKRKKCTPTKKMFVTQYTDCPQIIQDFDDKLKDLQTSADASVNKLKGLISKVKSLMLPVHGNKKDDLSVVADKFKDATSPVYTDAAAVSAEVFKQFDELESEILEAYKKSAVATADSTAAAAGGRKNGNRTRRQTRHQTRKQRNRFRRSRRQRK